MAQQKISLSRRAKIILAIVSGVLFLFFGFIAFFELAMLGFTDSPISPSMEHEGYLRIAFTLLIPLIMTILMYWFAYISKNRS